MHGKRCKKRPSLNETEWAFHKVELSELAVCLRHEQSRGYEPRRVRVWQDKPWLKLKPTERQFLKSLYEGTGASPLPSFGVGVSTPKPTHPGSLANLVYGYAEKLARRTDPLWKPPVESVNFAIDWRVSDTGLLLAFKRFLRPGRRIPLSAARQYQRIAKTRGTGRPRDCARRLVDIALLRCKAAGLNRPQTIDQLRPLLENFQFLQPGHAPRDGSIFSEKNWSTTLKEARSR